MNASLRLPVADASQAGEARRLASAWMRGRGWGEQLEGTVALVVTELGRNLALHTRGGELLLRNLSHAADHGVEILSLDSGPGVENFSECMRDGHSTAGTAGIGLGAVQRASSLFEVFSRPGIGTALLCQLWAKPPGVSAEKFEAGAAAVALAGQEVSGDTWAAQFESSERARLILADGLGHGELAADASQKAVQVFSEGARWSLVELMQRIHEALRSTRGAAVAVAEIDPAKGRVSYVGLGNISASIVTAGKSVSLVSHNGTAGGQYRTIQEFTYSWTAGAFLVMHSDGIKTQWQLERYTGLGQRHPGLVAGVLYRDFHRPNDDSTVVVMRARP